jgi:hypothetical protein
MCVLGDAVAPRVDLETPLNAIDDVGFRVGDAFVAEQTSFHLVGESLILGDDLLSMH